MTQITKRHLAFVEEAKGVFEDSSIRETCRSDDDSLIALRMGADGDCVEVWELGNYVANFVQQMEPCPTPRTVVREFGFDMEKQLAANEHKGGWQEEHWDYLYRQIAKNVSAMLEVLRNGNKDKHEITIRCANIANFAMMIADNEGEHL